MPDKKKEKKNLQKGKLFLYSSVVQSAKKKKKNTQKK